MIFTVQNIKIYFPYKSISHEQISYIKELIKSFKIGTNLMIEMAAGAGKTMCLLSAAVSFQIFESERQKPKNETEEPDIEKRKFIYCTRTVPETEKTLNELKILIDYIKKEHRNLNFLGLGLTSRKHFCVNPKIRNVEIECRQLLSQDKCLYYDRVNEFNIHNSPIKSGVYTIDELTKIGKDYVFCPYFFVRKFSSECDILICTFNYVLDPSISSKISFPKKPIILFDEAHNIDNTCLEAFKHEITRELLQKCRKGILEIENEIKKRKKALEVTVKENVSFDLRSESKNNFAKKKSVTKISPEKKDFKSDIEYSKIISFPGAIRKDIHVLSILKRILEFLKIKFKSTHLTINSPYNFLKSLCSVIFSNKKTLSQLFKRYNFLPILFSENTDSVNKIVSFIDTICSFSTSDAFVIVYEPNKNNISMNINPKLTLSCNDSRIAIKRLIDHHLLVITSGTLTPFSTYKDLLGIDGRTVSIRNDIKPDLLIVTKGNDQITITSIEETLTKENKIENQSEIKNEIENKKIENQLENIKIKKEELNEQNLSSSFKLRNTPSTIRNYISLLTSLSLIIPDGMIVFFPSYLFMSEIISKINLKRLDKPIFIETVNYKESILALENYKKSIENGRGGLFLCVARGKVSEGIDFKDHIGRGCLLIGVPFAYTESIIIKERVKYLKNNLNIHSFLQFDALRHAMQCLGRVIRGKNDYGLMLMADYRYNKYISTLSNNYEVLDSLSTDMAVNYGKLFFRKKANREEIKMLEGEDVQKYCGTES